VVFLLAIVLSVLLRYTDSDCPFGIFKLFYNRIVTSDQEYSNRGDIYLKHYSSKAPKNENLSNHFRITLEKS
jgi:hypothetical protein